MIKTRISPERARDFKVLALTDEAPTDGVAVSLSLPAATAARLEQVFLGLHRSKDGARLLSECFHADRFEAAPRMGYRALYRVALASL